MADNTSEDDKLVLNSTIASSDLPDRDSQNPTDVKQRRLPIIPCASGSKDDKVLNSGINKLKTEADSNEDSSAELLATKSGKDSRDRNSDFGSGCLPVTGDQSDKTADKVMTEAANTQTPASLCAGDTDLPSDGARPNDPLVETADKVFNAATKTKLSGSSFASHTASGTDSTSAEGASSEDPLGANSTNRDWNHSDKYEGNFRMSQIGNQPVKPTADKVINEVANMQTPASLCAGGTDFSSKGARPKDPLGNQSVKPTADKVINEAANMQTPASSCQGGTDFSSKGARPKDPLGTNETSYIKSAWHDVDLKITVKAKDGGLTDTSHIYMELVPKLQFLVLESGILKEKVRYSVDKSFKVNEKTLDDKIQVKFTLNSVSKIAGTEIMKTLLEVLNNLMGSLFLDEITLDRNDFECFDDIVKKEILPTLSRNVHIYHKEKEKIIIVGQKPEAGKVFMQIKGVLKPATKEGFAPLGDFDHFLFEKLKEKDTLCNKYGGVQIENVQGGLKITGLQEQVQQIIAYVKVWPSQIKDVKEIIDENKLRLLSFAETRQYVESCVHGKGIICTYSVDENSRQLQIFAKSEEVANMAFGFILKSIEEYNVKTDSNLVCSHPAYDEFLRNHLEKTLIQIENEDQSITLVATADAMLQFHKLSEFVIQQEYMSLKKSGTQMPEGNTTQSCQQNYDRNVINLNTENEFLMKDKEVMKEFKHKFPNVVVGDESRMSLMFCGTASQIQKTQNEVNIFFESFCKEQISIDSDKYNLINDKPEVEKYLTEQLIIAKQIPCVWYIYQQAGKEDYIMWTKAKDKKVAQAGLQVLNKSISKCSVLTKITPEIKDKIQEIEQRFSSKGRVIGNDVNEGNTDDYYITIVATSDVIDKFESQIQHVISGYSSFVNVRLEKFHYLQRFLQNKIQELERKFNLKVWLNHPPSICLKAGYNSTNNIQFCIDDIWKLCKQEIDVDCVRVQDRTFYADSTRLQWLNSIEEKYLCVFSHNISKPVQICTLSLLENDFHIAVIHGRTCDLVVDAVVVPVNECLFPVGYSDDDFKGDPLFQCSAKKNISIQNVTKFRIGHVEPQSVEAAYPFHTALLTVVTEKNSTVEDRDIVCAIRKVFQYCEKEGIQSVAIPVQIIEGEKASKQVNEILNAMETTYKFGVSSCVQEVYLCILDEFEINEVVTTVFASKKAYQKFDQFDWRPMLLSPNENKGSIHKIGIDIAVGSLVEQQVDMLVNTVGTDLDLSNGFVSKTILDRAGHTIQEYCNDKYPRGIKHGTVVETPAGSIKQCHSLCHGALTGWHHRTNLSLQVLRLVIWQCLTVANTAGYTSVALPAFGTGRLRYPSRKVAETMFEIIDRFSVKVNTCVKNVQIVLFGKDEGHIKIFRAVHAAWKQGNLATFKGDASPFTSILQCTVPAEYGNVCVQIWPLDKSSVDGDLVAYFDTKYSKDPDLKYNADGSVTGTFYAISSYNTAIEDIFLLVEKLRVTKLSIIVESGIKESTEKLVKTIKQRVFNDTSDRGYLETVKIYIEDLGQFTRIVEKPPQQDEGNAFIEYFKKKSGFKRHKVYSKWIKTVPQNETEYHRIVITGKQDNVQSAKHEITLFLKDAKNRAAPQNNQLVIQKWAVRDIEGKVTNLQPEICSYIALEMSKGGKIVQCQLQNGVWIFDIQRNLCYPEGNQQSTLELVTIDSDSTGHPPARESSVGPVTLPNSSLPNQDIFTFIKAEINMEAHEIKNNQTLEEMIETFGIRHVKHGTGKWEIEAENFDQVKKLNKSLKECLSFKNGSALSYSQKRQGDKHSPNITQTKKKSKPEDNFENIICLPLSQLHFNMLQFFCPNSKIFFGKWEYTDGILMRSLQSQENEKDLKVVFESQMKHIQSLSNVEVHSSVKIDDEKLHEVQRNVREAGEIFCYCSEDKKMLTLYGISYEKLGAGKHMAEIALGLKEQSKGRRNRVFNTDSESNNTRSSDSNVNPTVEQNLKRSVGLSRSVSASYSPPLEQTFKTTEGIIVKVYVGNILTLDVDCIVNAANETLSHGGGVARVIAEAAGYDFEKESDEYVRQNGQIAVGTCCTTSAGRLKYKCVIHTVGPKWHMYSDKKYCCLDLRKAVESCFYEAEVNSMTSIALPSISAGIFGVPIEVCCSEYCNAVVDFSAKNGYKTCLKEIHFIDKDASLITIIQKEFSQKLNRTSSVKSNYGSANQSSMSQSGKDHRITRSSSVPEDGNTVKEKPVLPSALGGSMNKFPKQFIVNKDLKVTVVQDDITTMKVSTIVCPQDEHCSNRGAIAQAIEKISDEKYRREVMGLKKVSVGDIRKVNASPPSLPFQYVLQTIPPRFDKFAEAVQSSFDRDLQNTIKNILRHCCDKKDVISVALPVLGIGKHGTQTPVTTFAKLFLKVLGTELKSGNKCSLKDVYIVTNDIAAASTIAEEFAQEKSFKQVTSFHRSRNKGEKTNGKQDSDDTKPSAIGQSFKGSIPKDATCVICMETLTKPRQLKCGHMFCTHCIEGQFKVKPVCPTCGSIQGVVTGDQPPGKMNRHDAKYSLPGYSDVGTIEISYEIYDGYQGKEHPNPEKFYKGIKRTAYLPNTKKGRLVADLLKVAFDRKLVFTIGHSRTTGEQGVVTWNDIHHKTSNQRGHQFGYPDDTYLDRVLDELKVKGVTEADVVKK